ncbi:MAG: SPFH domain-containing protein, partial [Phycisphaerae bacterium]
WIVPLLLVQAAVLWLLTAFVVVPQGFEAVIEQFRLGGSSVSAAPAGLTFKWPWPIDRATLIAHERIRRLEIGYDKSAEEEDGHHHGDENSPELWSVPHRGKEYALLVPDRQAAADDSLPLNLLSMTIPIQWRVRAGETLKFHRHARDVPHLVESMAYQVLTRFASQADVTDLLSTGGARAGEEIQTRLQAALDRAGPSGEGLGVEIVHVSMANLHPITQAAVAYESAISSYQKKQARIETARGDAESNKVGAGGLVYAQLYDAILAEEAADRDYRSATAEGGDAAAARSALDARTREVEHLLREKAGGSVREIVSRAERRAFARVYAEMARAERYGIQLKAYEAAPRVFLLRKYLAALRDALRNSRKYILLIADKDRVLFEFDDGTPIDPGLIQSTIAGLKQGE